MKILSKNHENKTDGLVMSECQVPKAWAAALPYPWPWKKVDTKEPQHLDKLPLLPFLWPAAGKYLIQGDNNVPTEARSISSRTLQACRIRGCYNTRTHYQSYFYKYNAWWNKFISFFPSWNMGKSERHCPLLTKFQRLYWQVIDILGGLAIFSPIYSMERADLSFEKFQFCWAAQAALMKNKHKQSTSCCCSTNSINEPLGCVWIGHYHALPLMLGSLRTSPSVH